VSKDTIHAPLCGAIHKLRKFYIQMNWLRRELMLTHHELTANRHELNCAAAQFIKAAANATARFILYPNPVILKFSIVFFTTRVIFAHRLST